MKTKFSQEYHPGKMQKSFDQWVEEEKKEHNMSAASDEGTEGLDKKPKEEVQNPSKEPIVPGGAPGPKSPEDIKKNPNEALNYEIVKEMGAK